MLHEVAAAYMQSLKQTETYRNMWNGTTEKLLLGKLLEIAHAYPNIGWKVDRFEAVGNLESIGLIFPDGPSGLTDRSTGILKPIEKKGAKLIFGQMYNGKIAVVLSFPLIEGATQPLENKILDHVTPDEITPAFIEKQVESFLEELKEWETGEERNLIGYRK